ncbi:hypothetical protein FMM05_15590 [Flavobacterium zepuense]|uniref:Methylamine utilisation protein MauE domain-containing protein n=1 Tax=Flavobacterium zepuense TaxID=2593302 RepID=A0A552UY25_9FLAO|nr:MauE/DoxX family redox-associated membrane protein [Flavobacterium zepuense]TRW23112.1 hypothetical protein FMM05_15590 [Flavobacterium zepuense]
MKFFLPVLIAILSAALGIFYIYTGVDKHFLSPSFIFPLNSTVPQAYRTLVGILYNSGFTKIVGGIEIAAGLMLIVPKTRPLGIVVILPVIITIFLLHALLDNRIDELIEAGIPLAATLLIFAYHQKNWKAIIAR